MKLFFDFCVIPQFLPEFIWAEPEIVMNSRREQFLVQLRDKRRKTQKSTNSLMSSLGLIEKNLELSPIY